MLSPITAIIKSFVFSVLNSFLGDTYKKREWNRECRQKVLLLGVLRFEQFFGDAYKKSKKIRPTEMLVLLLCLG